MNVRHANPVTQAGYTPLPNAILLRAHLSANAKVVYTYLKHLAWSGRNDDVEATRETIAEALGLGVKVVTATIRELSNEPAEEGATGGAMLLVAKRRGLGLSNLYLIEDPMVLSGKAESAVQETPDQPFSPLSQDFVEQDVKPMESEADSAVQVAEVYDHWRHARGRTRLNYQRISDGRRSKILARLRDGYTTADLCRAIDGVALDPWKDRPHHDDLTVIFRNREQVDKFLELADGDARDRNLSADDIFKLAAEAERRGL